MAPLSRTSKPLMKSFLYSLVCVIASAGISGAIPFGFWKAAAGGGGGPTLIASDNFDAYSGATDLDAAANWVGQGGAINVHDNAGDKSAKPGASVAGLYRHTGTFNTNQRAEITIDSVAAGGGFDWIGPAVRVQSGANTGTQKRSEWMRSE